MDMSLCLFIKSKFNISTNKHRVFAKKNSSANRNRGFAETEHTNNYQEKKM